jgi:hypothetical protein
VKKVAAAASSYPSLQNRTDKRKIESEIYYDR